MQTKREYVVSLGLAKPGKGKFSKAAKEAIAKAEAEGVTFALTRLEMYQQERVNKPKRVAKPKPEKVERPKQDVNIKAVRSWAEQIGLIEKGKRGRVPNAVIAEYLASNVVTPKEVRPVKRVIAKVREETVGWTYAKRKSSDPAYISEPLVALTSCGSCKKPIAYCGGHGSDNLPMAPEYLGGQSLMLTNPAE